MSNRTTVSFAVILTAALTALGTSLVSEWLPSIAKALYERITAQPILVVEVKRGRRGVSGVALTAADVLSDVALGSGVTNENGLARLNLGRTPRLVFLHGTYREGSFERVHKKTHEVVTLPRHLPLDVERDFDRMVVVAQVPLQTPPASSPQVGLVQYGAPLLSSDRQVTATLEIDWVVDTPRVQFEAEISTGVVRLKDLLDRVGIDMEIMWSDELPRTLMGPDQRFNQQELLHTMEHNRASVPGDRWHFYLILGGQHEFEGLLSIMFDTDARRGAAVFDAMNQLGDPGRTLFTVLHAIGHMLNLPHPWQAYGDTKSVMTYPHRWGDQWSYADSEIYQFDAFGKQHIRRAPEQYVRPGRSAFLDYGEPLPWLALRR